MVAFPRLLHDASETLKGAIVTADEFMRQFEASTLPAETFHHRDHVRMAYLYLINYPALQAIERYSAALQRLAAARGVPGRYHETITWAHMLLVRERMARTPGTQTWEEFAEANPDLLDWKNSVLKRYYRDETLASELARVTFLFPDAPRRE
jgi:hypothetical protein